MTTVLTIGGIQFEGFEVPEKINFGGQQVLVAQKLTGGQRIIDVMGPDDDDIKWSGRFRGSQAETRARSLDLMRRQGRVVQLQWSSLTFDALIQDFRADFMQPYEITYSITCVVVQDNSNPVADAQDDIDQDIGTDLTSILNIGASLNLPIVSAAINGVASATSSFQTFQGVSSQDIIGVQSSIVAAQSATTSAISTGNGTVAASGSVAGMTAGLNPSILASSLTGQATAFSNLGQLYQVNASLGRMATNLANGVG